MIYHHYTFFSFCLYSFFSVLFYYPCAIQLIKFLFCTVMFRMPKIVCSIYCKCQLIELASKMYWEINSIDSWNEWKHLNCFVDMSNCLAISMTSVDSRKKRVFSLISFIHYCSEASNKTARLKTKYIPSKHPFQTSIFTRSQWHNAHDYHSGQCPWSNQNVSTILSMFFS